MSAGALSLRNVTRRFGDHTAVDDLTLEVKAGELLALVGASGSGKTTTLRIAAGYEAPDAGSVHLTDAGGTLRDITRVPPAKRGFGMVFQHYALFPHMSVEENVAFGLEARGVAKRVRLARARDALDTAGLGGKGARPVQALSGGEQQRVALARALVIEPQVLLLDEPLSNLDPTLRQSTRDDLRAMLRRLHVTALFVTHDQEDAFAIADRVAVLSGGRLLQVGTPEELYARPVSRAVAEFVGRATLVPATVGDGRVTIEVGGVRQTATVDGDASSGAAMAVLRPQSVGLAPAGAAGTWPGVVSSRRFAGSAFVYRVRLDSGTEMEVAASTGATAEGDRAGVCVTADRVSVVPA